MKKLFLKKKHILDIADSSVCSSSPVTTPTNVSQFLFEKVIQRVFSLPCKKYKQNAYCKFDGYFVQPTLKKILSKK